MDWFRSWHGAPTDNKWLVIGKKADVAPGIVSAVVWALLDHASTNEVRGSVEGFDAETYSVFSGFEEGKVRAVVTALIDKGLIENNTFKSWDARQPKREDNSSSRTQRYRENKKDVTPRDAAVTQGDAPEKIQIREDKKVVSKETTKRSRAIPELQKPDDVSEGIWIDFVSMRKKKRAPITETALTGIREESRLAGWVLQRALAECCARGWQGFKAEWVAPQGQAPPSSGTWNGNQQNGRSNAPKLSKSDRARAALFADLGPEPGGPQPAS